MIGCAAPEHRIRNVKQRPNLRKQSGGHLCSVALSSHARSRCRLETLRRMCRNISGTAQPSAARFSEGRSGSSREIEFTRIRPFRLGAFRCGRRLSAGSNACILTQRTTNTDHHLIHSHPATFPFTAAIDAGLSIYEHRKASQRPNEG
ncbi:hypothetical protein PHSY_004650 [Pseudozyma hubeiensis SY62]|uniref:Uncharacterized protein n=1 Tax=Pseudozyma hubeiensis (strain SY62) TaxID=1305764 RepID=R9P6S9_PSEHS|nr:hypothetical protein PHSY_004650 [Pseudozyma hubeiensis SY62]GAC97066.1 hypothetical protein PHSY_004650 [Pseudozyma hubeiensis SY62]